MNEKQIQLAHGGGGRLSKELIEKEILGRFSSVYLQELPDASAVPGCADLVFSTDGFVVSPLEFPGGNIGDLAVHGTVNDIAVSGAVPLCLSLSMILEEGLEIAVLQRVLDSVQRACRDCQLPLICGDTKVVPKGACDGMYLTSSAVGRRLPGFKTAASSIQPGDVILVNGTLGDHGMAVMSARNNLSFSRPPVSDTASVFPFVQAIQEFAPMVRFMRDPTRGGLAAVLNEIFEHQPYGAFISEDSLPFSGAAQTVSELLGIELLHSASEGRLVLICAPEVAPEILSCWRKLLPENKSSQIGVVRAESAGRVVMETSIGGSRRVDLPLGELLPRIC
jgi:hydrogenase expression/formation protein HypE